MYFHRARNICFSMILTSTPYNNNKRKTRNGAMKPTKVRFHAGGEWLSWSPSMTTESLPALFPPPWEESLRGGNVIPAVGRRRPAHWNCLLYGTSQSRRQRRHIHGLVMVGAQLDEGGTAAYSAPMRRSTLCMTPLQVKKPSSYIYAPPTYKCSPLGPLRYTAPLTAVLEVILASWSMNWLQRKMWRLMISQIDDIRTISDWNADTLIGSIGHDQHGEWQGSIDQVVQSNKIDLFDIQTKVWIKSTLIINSLFVTLDLEARLRRLETKDDLPWW